MKTQKADGNEQIYDLKQTCYYKRYTTNAFFWSILVLEWIQDDFILCICPDIQQHCQDIFMASPFYTVAVLYWKE